MAVFVAFVKGGTARCKRQHTRKRQGGGQDWKGLEGKVNEPLTRTSGVPRLGLWRVNDVWCDAFADIVVRRRRRRRRNVLDDLESYGTHVSSPSFVVHFWYLGQ